MLYFWLKLFQYLLGYVFVVSISWLLNAINCNLFVRVPRSNYQTLMKVTFLFWFCYNDESIVLETAVLSDDWGQSLCGWMDIECSNSSVSTTISGDRAASGAARNATIGPDSLFCGVYEYCMARWYLPHTSLLRNEDSFQFWPSFWSVIAIGAKWSLEDYM